MPTIKIEVKNKVATAPQDAFIVCENSDYEIEFEFDELWESESIKTARFYYNFKHKDILIEGNTCKIPPLEETKLLKVGVFTDNIKTSTDAEIRCEYSIKKYGGGVVAPTEDVYAQIIELLNKYIEQGGSGGISEEQVKLLILQFAVTQESDPTVPNWAKEPTKPTYTYEEITGKPDLVEDLGSSVAEETNELTIELKDKNGNVLATSTVTLPTQEVPEAVDVQINGTSIVDENGVANIPIGNQKLGLINVGYGTYGLIMRGQEIAIYQPETTKIDLRNTWGNADRYALTLNHIDYAVKLALTTNSLTLTDEEKAAARAWLGIE